MEAKTPQAPTEGPCKCDHLNEPAKPEYRPCKQDEPVDEPSTSSGKSGSCYCCVRDPEPLKSELPLKQYIEEEVTPAVMDGFQAVLQKLPPDPIKFLKNFYENEADNCALKVPPHL